MLIAGREALPRLIFKHPPHNVPPNLSGISRMPASMRYDEQAYLAANPDIRDAVAGGHIKSGKDHFDALGHKEDRPGLLPCDFDEANYLARNPSVAALVQAGEFPSGGYHYALFGKDRKLSYRRPGATRRSIVEKLWYGRDPFASFPAASYTVDKRGWNSSHAYLSKAIQDLRPELVIEVGVWKGGSTMTMARKMRELQLDSVVLSVDTWLGSSEHWLIPEQFFDLGFESGYPKLYHRFASNVVSEDLQDYVVPLPLDSNNAVVVCKDRGLRPQVMHIDAGHDYASVMADLSAWWPLIEPGGVLIADDYFPEGGGWPGVLAAVDDFFKVHSHVSFESTSGKALVRKCTDAD